MVLQQLLVEHKHAERREQTEDLKLHAVESGSDGSADV